MRNKQGKIIGGAVVLGIGAFLAKLLGATYRVPLTNMLGGQGLGLYQMVFPVYSVLLDFSGGGVPSAMSKLISSEKEENRLEKAKEYLKASVKTLVIFGFIGTLLMSCLSLPLSVLQGDSRAFLGYIFLAPAVLLVSVLSCFRGYFQGLMNMSPTAISQVVEQFIKLVFGVILVKLFLPNLTLAVAGATLAITFSELIAFLYLYITYRKKGYSLKINLEKNRQIVLVKRLIKIAFPVTLVCVMIPLSQVIDSFLILNILSGYRKDATALYGLLSGVVGTVIGLPVAVCHGIATVTVPAVSRESLEINKDRAGKRTLGLTLLASIPCAVVTFVFAPLIIKLLFNGLASSEKSIAVTLLRLSSPCIVLLSFLQTGNAVLIGKGKVYAPVLSLGMGVVVKIVLNALLLNIPEINIYGGAIATIACYFTVCLVNLIMIFKFRVNNGNQRACRRQFAN